MSSSLPWLQLDVFTTEALAGNPCAVVFEAQSLDAARMQRVASEMNLSETAFVRQVARDHAIVRYFTPIEEIPFAGHPTVAVAWALVASGRWTPPQGRVTRTLELAIGPVEVTLEGFDGRLDRVVMSQRAPQFLAVLDPADVLPAFGLTPEDLLPGAPIQIVSTGTPQLMIPLLSLDALRRVAVDDQAYTRLRARHSFFSPHLFVLQGFTPRGRTAARHLGGPFEDPFTGSATGGMAAYLWRHRLIDQPGFVAEQGHDLGRPGWAEVMVVGRPDAITAVRVAGSAVVVIAGELWPAGRGEGKAAAGSDRSDRAPLAPTPC